MEARPLVLFVMLLVKGTTSFGEMDEVGALQFRISESEFSKVSHALLMSDSSYITYTGDNSVHGETGGFRYTFNQTVIKKGTPAIETVTIPEDDHIRATTTFENMRVTGVLALSKSDMEDDVSAVDVLLRRITIVAEGKVDTISVIGDLKRVILSVPECRVSSMDYDNDGLGFGGTGLEASDMEHVIGEAICSMFHLKFSLGFEEAKVDLHLEVFDLYIKTRAISLQIKNSTVIITQVLETMTNSEGIPSYVDTDDVISQFPPLRENSEPFEIWMSQGIVLDMWRVYKEEQGIGVKPIPLVDLLPVLDISEYDTGRIPFIPQIYYTFPNATATLVVTDGDIRLNVTDDKIHFNFNLSGSFEVTLNCDRSRKYSALDFQMSAHVPTQIGTNNRALILQFWSFGGNMTVLSSNIGHVAGRHLHVTFWTLPQILGRDVFKDLNSGVKGIGIKTLLPVDLYLENIALSMAKGHIIVGGRLSDVDPKLPKIPREDIDWLGDISMLKHLIFPIHDPTPEDLKPLPEQNCTVPTVSAAVGVLMTKLILYTSVLFYVLVTRSVLNMHIL